MSSESPEYEKLRERLKEEALTYCNLSKEYNNESYYREEKEAYILSEEWVEKWKEYVDYETIKKMQYSHYNQRKSIHKVKPEAHPGKITNSTLLVPLNEFYNDGDPNNRENQVIRHDVNQYKEIKIVNEKIWKFFHERYGGGPEIIKPSIEEETRYSVRKIIEIFYKKVTFINF